MLGFRARKCVGKNTFSSHDPLLAITAEECFVYRTGRGKHRAIVGAQKVVCVERKKGLEILEKGDLKK